MENRSILYWKWHDGMLTQEQIRAEIDSIVSRSCYTDIYVTTHWCQCGICHPSMPEIIRSTCDYLHSLGRRLLFEIDPRAEKKQFVDQHPNLRMGFLYWQETSDAPKASLPIPQGAGGGMFFGEKQSGETLLSVKTYRKMDGRILPESVRERRNECILRRVAGREVEVTLPALEDGEYAFTVVNSLVDFLDFFSSESRVFFQQLFETYRTIPLDGVALDEMGFPWHTEWNFNPNTYLLWNNSPLFSENMAKQYQLEYTADYLEDCLYRFCDSVDSSRRIRAINRYFEYIRKAIVDQETYFYKTAKEVFGQDVFVGAHPTWYAIEEVQNTPEIWKNGVDWWEVPRDHGFTDEITPYPVRLALAHKAKSPVFYNMWYSEGTLLLDSYFPEMWRNIRYGGRTITLGYECIHETNLVLSMKTPGYLEQVSAIEERIVGVDKFQVTAAASDVLIIMGIEASANYLMNRDGIGGWNTHNGVFKECFTLARDLFSSGYNCDLVADYEIYNGALQIDEEGHLRYGTQRYSYAIIAYPQFAKRELLTFLEKLNASQTAYCVVGDFSVDFDGNDVSNCYEELIKGRETFAIRPEITDVVALFPDAVATNRVPNGCVFQDGSIVLTAPACSKPVGNRFTSRFTYRGKSVYAEAEDVACLRFDEKGQIVERYSPNWIALEISDAC